MDPATRAELDALRRELTEQCRVFAAALVRSRADADDRFEQQHSFFMARWSNALAACEKAVFKAEMVDRDQAVTRYRLDDLDTRLKAIERQLRPGS